jgi:hypothetical protein
MSNPLLAAIAIINASKLMPVILLIVLYLAIFGVTIALSCRLVSRWLCGPDRSISFKSSIAAGIATPILILAAAILYAHFEQRMYIKKESALLARLSVSEKADLSAVEIKGVNMAYTKSLKDGKVVIVVQKKTSNHLMGRLIRRRTVFIKDSNGAEWVMTSKSWFWPEPTPFLLPPKCQNDDLTLDSFYTCIRDTYSNSKLIRLAQ